MPVSGFQIPQAPDWTRFAEKAIDLQANRPVVNTAEIVNQAVNQINGILKLASPEERLKRQVELTQLGALKDLYTHYREHPDQYTMTAHGPVLTDPYQRAARIASINHTVASTNYLNKKIQGSGTPSFIADAIKRMQQAQAAERQGVSLAPSKMQPTTPTGGDKDATDNEDNTAEQDAVTDEGGVSSLSGANLPSDL